jgi:hypothetical protein
MNRIFATPSVILRSARSVGVALSMRLLDASVATTGSAVYMEYGAVGVSPPLHRKKLLGDRHAFRRILDLLRSENIFR